MNGNKKIWIVIILAAVLLIGGYVAWQYDQKSVDSRQLRIGVILPLTGSSAYIGQSIKSGMEISKEEFSSADNPAGAKADFELQIDYIDSGGVVSKVVSAYHNLVDIKNVQAIVPVQQGVKALIPLVAQDHRVLLATSVPDNGITGKNPWTFRFFINAESDASTIAAYARNKLKLKTAAIIYVNDDMGISYMKSFSRHFTQKGGEIILKETYNPADSHFREIALKVKQANPEAIYLVGYGNSMANIPIQLREAGVKATILSVGTISQPEIMKAAGEAANGIYYTTTKFFTFAPETEKLKQFVAKYKEKYGKVPVFFEVFGYDTLRLLLIAAQRQGLTPEALRDGLHTIKDEPMAVGRVTVGLDGDIQFPVVVKRIVDGKWVMAP
ncbi:MAG: ABC transporter substrate-binding protein [Xanthomonadaceae bacterium]|nr:ABC transporter substrate-binding protein [Xanthomonadaceae bacterium]